MLVSAAAFLQRCPSTSSSPSVRTPDVVRACVSFPRSPLSPRVVSNTAKREEMGEYRQEVPAQVSPGRGELCLGQL